MHTYLDWDLRWQVVQAHRPLIDFKRWSKSGDFVWPLRNVWVGVSAEDQPRLEARVSVLRFIPWPMRWLSLEPLLGQLDIVEALRPIWNCGFVGEDGCCEHPKNLTPECHADPCPKTSFPGIDWVVIGGESGAGARECNIDWIRTVVQQCAAACVPCFVKQLGREAYTERVEEQMSYLEERTTNKWYPHLEDTKGGDPAEWPEDLRVRQFPEAILPSTAKADTL